LTIPTSFLDSDTITLKAEHSSRSFRIHRKLLSSKCKAIVSALDRFEEGQKGAYTFEDTPEGTLARFIEWAYTGKYPTILTSPPEPAGQPLKTENVQVNGEGEDKSTVTTTTAAAAATATELDLASENHPLLAHIHLYIFCSIYLITELRDMASNKMMECFMDLDRPEALDTQLAVVSALRLAFRKLPPHDPLLDWLAQYASYCVDKLRMQTSFHDLLGESPVLSSRMVLSLNPASQAPWKIQLPKHKYPHYHPGAGGGDGIDYYN